MSQDDPADVARDDGGTAEPDAGDTGGGSSRHLLRSSGIVAVGTLLSRVTGLARTIMLARVIGAAGAANVYYLANTTPNLLYDLLLGGILSATLVPILVSNRAKKDDAATDAVVTVATVALVLITVLGLVLAPLIIRLYATFASGGGNPPSASEQELATTLLRLFVPQVLFYGLTTLGSAVLNAHRRFAAAAFAPVLNNVVMFGVLIVADGLIEGSLTVEQLQSSTALLVVLGGGTTLGIVVMAVALWPAIVRARIRLRWRLDWTNPAVKQLVRLSGWTFGYVIANQVALFVLTSLAWGSRDPQAVAAWNNAYQFFQLPYGVFTVSVMTAFTPELSALAARGDMQRFKERFLLGLRIVTLVILPSTVLFALLAAPLTSALFENGDRFTADDARVTAATIAGLAWGMVGFSAYLYVLRAFYALKDTKTPFVINLFENALTVALGLWLIRSYGVQGLAWSWSAGYMLSAVIAFVVLRRRLGPFGTRMAVGTTAPIARMIAAAAAMTAVVAVVAALLPSSGGGAWLTLAAAGVAGGGVYLGLLLLLGVSEVRDVPRMLLGRGD